MRLRSLIVTCACVAGLLAGVSSFAPPADAAGSTYWVDPGGSNSDPGTQTDPWRTIQYAANNAGAGDTINVMTGVYNESVGVNTSGTVADGPLVIRSAPGHAAILDGSTGVSDPNGFFIEDISWVTIDGFEIRNYTATANWELATGIYLAGDSHNIALTNNTIHTITSTATPNPIANGIGVYGTDPNPMTDITISGNELSDLILGWSESMVVNGNVDGFVIDDNVVHDNDNIGIDVIGYEEWIEELGVPAALNRARNGTISNNLVYNIDSSTNPVYGGERAAGGIYVDGGTDIDISGNVVHHANIGIELASEATDGFTENISLTENEIWFSDVGGLALGGYLSGLGTTRNVVVRNNSFFDNTQHNPSAAGELWMQYNVTGNTIEDNIVHSGTGNVLLSDPNSQSANNTIGSNTYAANGFNGFFQIGGFNFNQTLADPQFVDAPIGDLRILSTSPAVSSGVAVDGVTTPDRQGQARVVPATGSATCNGIVATIEMNTNGGNGQGTPGDDVIAGTPGDDVINGMGGDDIICGGAGADTIRGGPGADIIFGQDGENLIFGGGGADTIHGGSERDNISGQGGPDTIFGNGGNDTINGNGAADDIDGGPGDDIINGQNGADTVEGGPGDDEIRLHTGPDIVSGSAGADELYGGNGNDRFHGGPDNDICSGNAGSGDRADQATCELTPGIEIFT